MNLIDLVAEYGGNMIYSAGIHADGTYHRQRYPWDWYGMERDPSATTALAAVAYYKCVVSRSNDVLIGVYDQDGDYRPMIFRCDPGFTRRQFVAYVHDQIQLFRTVRLDELLQMYEANQVAYQELDFVVDLREAGCAAEEIHGLVHLSLANTKEGRQVCYRYLSDCISSEEIGSGDRSQLCNGRG